MPSLGARADHILEKAHYARQNGAGGLLVPPGLVGFDIMRVLAEDDTLCLPIMAHPAFIGSFVKQYNQGDSLFQDISFCALDCNRSIPLRVMDVDAQSSIWISEYCTCIFWNSRSIMVTES